MIILGQLADGELFYTKMWTVKAGVITQCVPLLRRISSILRGEETSIKCVNLETGIEFLLATTREVEPVMSPFHTMSISVDE